MLLDGLIVAIPFAVLLIAFCYKREQFEGNNLLIIIFAGFVIRVCSVILPEIHPTDMGCFYSWGDLLATKGFGNFYSAVDSAGVKIFTDYPPGYMYILWGLGWIRKLLNISYNSTTIELLFKLPSIMADILTAVFVYKIGAKFFNPKQTEGKISYIKKALTYTPFVAAFLYAVNPASVIDSAVWGQVDAIHTLTIIISIYYMIEKKYYPGLLLFVLSVFIKPQALMFTPIYLYVIAVYFIDRKFSKDAFLQLAEWAGVCIGVATLLVLPFSFTPDGFDLWPVIDQYRETLGSYPHITVNAYNTYALFGLNWKSIDMNIGFLTFDSLGVILLCIIVLFSFYLLLRNREKGNVFYVASVICILTFMLSVKMHERYAFPMMALLLLSYVYKPDKKTLALYILFSLSFFWHYADILNMSINEFNYELIKQTLPTIAFINVVLTVCLLLSHFKVFKVRQIGDELLFSDPEPTECEPFEIRFEKTPFELYKSEKNAVYTRYDVLAIAVITVVYAAVAFFNLGDFDSPQTRFDIDANTPVVIEFEKPEYISKVQYMLGARDNKGFNLSGTDTETGEAFDIFVDAKSVFEWENAEIGVTTDKITITAKNDDTWLQEMAFRGEPDEQETYLITGEIIPVKSVSDGQRALFDEQHTVPAIRTYLNGTYFDEIYHARTGYEFIHKEYVYEWTHPPLGKNIIALGIEMFGMTPFGWRFMGTLFGVLMVPFMYFFGKSLFKKTKIAVLTTVLFTFDFMHFAQTRIATIDTYIVFFVILMYWFMYMYYKKSFYDTKFWKTLIPLGLSGVCMGLGVASKWPGVYAGIGLAVLFFMTLFARYKEYLECKSLADTEFDLPEYAFVRQKFKKYTVLTLLFCILFFIIVPITIYLLSYIPYYATESLYMNRDLITFLNELPRLKDVFTDTPFGNYCAAVLQNQFDIYKYHSELVSAHPYEAKWFTWIFDLRPIFYYSGTFSADIRAGLSSFGNPAVWWGGLAALIYAMVTQFKKWDKTAIFLVLAYFAQLVPWFPITRTTYIYHYFPCVPFLALLVGYYFSKNDEKHPRFYYAAIAVTVALFAAFYPLITGTPVNFMLFKTMCEWFTGMWQLI